MRTPLLSGTDRSKLFDRRFCADSEIADIRWCRMETPFAVEIFRRGRTRWSDHLHGGVHRGVAALARVTSGVPALEAAARTLVARGDRLDAPCADSRLEIPGLTHSAESGMAVVGAAARRRYDRATIEPSSGPTRVLLRPRWRVHAITTGTTRVRSVAVASRIMYNSPNRSADASCMITSGNTVLGGPGGV